MKRILVLVLFLATQASFGQTLTVNQISVQNASVAENLSIGYTRVLAATDTYIGTSFTQINKWTESVDARSEFDPDTGVFTAKSAGWYRVVCNVNWRLNGGYTGSFRQVFIYVVASSSFTVGDTMTVNNLAQYDSSAVCEAFLSAGDTISIWTYSDGTTNQTNYFRLSIMGVP